MKKFFLLIIIALTFQSTISPMKRAAHSTLEQKNEKKVKIQPKAMIFELSDGTILTLTAKAVTLCDQLVDLLQYSQKDYARLYPTKAIGEIPFEFDMFNLTDNEATILFDILNTVARSARSYTDLKTQKCYYHNGDVFNLIINKCKENNVLETKFLTKMINVCDFLMCDTLVNAFTRQFVEGSRELMQQGLYVFNQFFNQSGAIKFLEKHMKRMAYGAIMNEYIPEYTLIDHIILNNGALPVINDTIKVKKNLTSLEGLEIIANNCNPLLIKTINLNNNYLGLTNNFTALNYFLNLTKLSLNNNELTQLPETIFNNLVNLTSLSLDDNELTQLPASLFNRLIRLTMLSLENNELTELPVSLFNGLVQLKSLSINNNQLAELPASLFNGLVQLDELFLNNNKLIQLPASLFEGLVNLTELYLEDNQLTELPASLFNGLVQLDTLYLNNNKLTHLPASLFNGLVQLAHLYLNNNELTELPASLFNGLVQLFTLYLNNNKLTELPASLFNGLVELEYLALNNNQLTELPASLFNGLVQLSELYLRNNQLTELPASLFNGLVGLTGLYLDNNQLTNLPDNIQKLINELGAEL